MTRPAAACSPATAPTVRRSLASARANLRGEGADLEAQLLLCEALRRPRSWLFAHGDTPLSGTQLESIRVLVRRRGRGEPIAYILGRREFWDVELAVSPQVLIPRPETELLVTRALELMAEMDAPLVLELGTGSGAIAIALARARPDARVLATDLCAAALQVARRNVQKLAPGRVALRRGDWFQGLQVRRFHLVLANPPYVADGDPHLGAGDVAFEPRQALVAGDDGLAALRVLAAGAPAHLHPGGHVLLEHGFDQGTAVRALLQRSGLTRVHTLRDLAGLERVAVARRAAHEPVQ